MNEILEDLKSQEAECLHDLANYRKWIENAEAKLPRLRKMIEAQEKLMSESAAFRAGNSLEQIMSSDHSDATATAWDDHKKRPDLTPKNIDFSNQTDITK